MRVSVATQATTRLRILEAARVSLQRDGWERTTTRAIAAEARIATGTLFNYFPTKEAIATALLREECERGAAEYAQRLRGDESLEEALFAWIWTGFRALRPYRALLAEAHLALFTPIVSRGQALQSFHLDALARILEQHRAPALSPVLIQVYWTLYLGVLAHWAADASPHQEDSLALLDQVLILFCGALEGGRAQAASAGALQ